MSGILPDSERVQISADVALVGANLPGNTECDPAPTVPGSSDHVDLMLDQSSRIRIFDSGGIVGRTCYVGGKDRCTPT